jgi:tRNA wybutosine-synthesizing protein 4
VTYDPIKPDDAFGRQMLMNLEARGCPFRSLAAARDADATAERLRACGWHRAQCRDMNHVYSRVLEPQARRAAERVEMLDELEEWHLMLAHYALAVGVNDAHGLLARVVLG